MNLHDFTLLQDVARADPSQVSRAVAQIEETLGLRIFQRTTRRLFLTEEGEAYLSRALPLAEELSRLTTEFRAGRAQPSGTLRLTASVTFGQRVIVPHLAAFRAHHPAVSIEAIFTDANLDLVAERIDLAIRLAPAVEGDVIAARLMDTRYRVVASPSYLARHPAPAQPQDLRDHRALLFPFRPYRSRWLFRQGGTHAEVPVAGDISLSPAGALHDAALAGLGPALLPDWLVDGDLRAGNLIRLLPAWDVTATTFDTGAWAVYPSRSFLPAKVRAMIDFLRTVLSAPAPPV
jgi:DNA-binding transcriptional LysR family regulator